MGKEASETYCADRHVALEMEMTDEEQEDLTAELLVTNQTLVFIVRSIASLAEKEGIPREVFFRTWLENGTQAMARTRLVGIPPERQDRVLEKARARYEDLVMACAAPPAKG
jgi:DNA-binding phage protein